MNNSGFYLPNNTRNSVVINSNKPIIPLPQSNIKSFPKTSNRKAVPDLPLRYEKRVTKVDVTLPKVPDNHLPAVIPQIPPKAPPHGSPPKSIIKDISYKKLPKSNVYSKPSIMVGENPPIATIEEYLS